jgi:uncharacterized protein (DUF924 family)
MAPPSAQDVLQFWFGRRPFEPVSLKQHARLWFGDDNAPELTEQTDELIRERFGALMAAAERDELKAWESSPRRRLALILLLDQFSRNVYRGTARAFAQDAKAQVLTLSGMQFGADATLDPVERIFFYMPLQHAESRELQEESVAAFRRLREEAAPEFKDMFESALKWAQQHQQIIERFGRFPARNQALGRDGTRVEEQWLRSQH